MAKSIKPERFPTGVRGTTVVNPMYLGHKNSYEGDPAKLDFKQQFSNYHALEAILKRNGQKMDWVGVAKYLGRPDYMHRADPNRKVNLVRFVATSPNLIWEKYEGDSAGGGQNNVYVGGVKMHLTDFLRLSPKKQDAYVTGAKVHAVKYEYRLRLEQAGDHQYDTNKRLSNSDEDIKASWKRKNAFRKVMEKFAKLTKATDFRTSIDWWKYHCKFVYKDVKTLEAAAEAAKKAFPTMSRTRSKATIK